MIASTKSVKAMPEKIAADAAESPGNPFWECLAILVIVWMLAVVLLPICFGKQCMWRWFDPEFLAGPSHSPSQVEACACCAMAATPLPPPAENKYMAEGRKSIRDSLPLFLNSSDYSVDPKRVDVGILIEAELKNFLKALSPMTDHFRPRKDGEVLWSNRHDLANLVDKWGGKIAAWNDCLKRLNAISSLPAREQDRKQMLDSFRKDYSCPEFAPSQKDSRISPVMADLQKKIQQAGPAPTRYFSDRDHWSRDN